MYRLLIQFLDANTIGSSDLVNHEELFSSYRKAKKKANKMLKTLYSENKSIVKAVIQAVLLEENLLGNSE